MMKKSILRVMVILLSLMLSVSVLASCGEQGEQGPIGPTGQQGEQGPAGRGIESIIKTFTDGMADTYTVTYTDGSTTTFIVTNGSDGAVGIQGVKGDDGHSPVVTIENGRWYIDGIDSGVSAAGVDGENGMSAFEIYQKYHPDYKGTEADWIESLKGEQGVGIVNAYVDDDLHLWIVLSNGNKIDAGYVGVSSAPAPTVYTVTFLDHEGKIIKAESVEAGKGATAPSAPERTGYRFTGWDCDFSNVTSSITVTAQYVQQFTVTFKDYDGTVLKTQIVDKGSNAIAPITPTREGYDFVSWSGSYTNVTADQTVVATYVASTPSATYTVTFYDYDRSTVLGTQTVAEGKAATPPADPSKAGAKFIGWSGCYTDVTNDESVYAVYNDSKNVFVVESATVSSAGTVTVLVSVDGVVKTCGFDLVIYYDNTVLELVSYDADLDLDVVVNTGYLDNGVLLNFSAATEKTKSRDIIELTFKVTDDTADATGISIEMTSVKEMNGTTIVNSTYETVEGVVTIK